MHKYFLTPSECSIIHGSEAIVARIGGFPSMENGRLKTIII